MLTLSFDCLDWTFWAGLYISTIAALLLPRPESPTMRAIRTLMAALSGVLFWLIAQRLYEFALGVAVIAGAVVVVMRLTSEHDVS